MNHIFGYNDTTSFTIIHHPNQKKHPTPAPGDSPVAALGPGKSSLDLSFNDGRFAEVPMGFRRDFPAVVSIHGGIPKMMVYSGESHLEMDDWGVPLF